MTRRTLAAAVTGLVSLSLVGVALANEPDDPILGAEPEKICEELVADEGTDGTTDEGPSEDCVPADGTEGTEGTDDEPEATVADLEEEEEEEAEADLDEGERPLNHGWYVSEATKTCPESGRARGECISAVAKSDLGKPHAEDSDAPEGPEAEDTSSVDDGGDDSPTPKPAKAAKGSKGGGGSKGRGAKG